MSKEDERKEMLKNHGYLTVNILIQKLQELKDKGHGDDLVGSDYEHYMFCGRNEFEKYVVIC